MKRVPGQAHYTIGQPRSDTTAPAQRLRWASAAMRDLEDDIACAVDYDANVMITGESGVGKKFIAQMIHQESRRSGGPFVVAGCPEVIESLRHPIERRLGRRGSASAGRSFLNEAQGGTLVMERIEETSLADQSELAEFIDADFISRGVRLITVTSADLFDRVQFSLFREDLFYRLNVIQLQVPALRDRPEDIPILLQHYLSLYRGVDTPMLSTSAWRRLVEYPWPENVLELKSVAAKLTAQRLARPVEPDDLPPEIGS